ncbi:hypothetical protein EJ04DRAFT_512441 [Polyplosphaeria fusca]|uniref:LysM domain-containing protein n=1 Tax=Polyplosphaeria fusca TaxID=682080 RepID=A0A9P4QVS1_9PLEO|nr:hypothetical protein EJ04DRAFT_512441 [Polyplosphaeria fusca]
MRPTNGPQSSKSSSTLAAPSLRARTRRLISVDDELDPISGSESGASPRGSRTASPTPGSDPSHPNVTSNPTSFIRSTSAHTPKNLTSPSAALSGLWGSSWSAIQGLATNVLGNETPAHDTTTRRRKPLSGTHRRTSSSSVPKKWGPSSSSAQIGTGPQEERENLVRAMKRRDMLTAGEHLVADSVGRIKRRTSDERLSASAPPSESDDRDALVYIHHVRPQDTLAGITIKFNCQAAILRKANRMWPNDTVQTKDTIVLPVDACGVKGKPVPGPEEQHEDLLLGDWGNSATTTTGKPNPQPPPNGWDGSTEGQIDASAQSHAEPEHPWKHNSWVLLPNDSKPTEIGRMPRRALGFFPPARRKSLAFSEASTPRPSFDQPRSSISSNPITSHTKSPSQASSSMRPRAGTGRSSFSSTQGRHRSLSNQFNLLGPGGVGTMGKNVRSPGPAQDGLNKLFASHLPDVRPPPGQEYFTPWAPSLLDADTGTTTHHGGSGALTPLGGGEIDLQKVGGAIEGWMRKMGTNVSKMLTEPGTPGQGKRSAVPVLGAVGGDLGDLIELRDDAFEIGDGEDERGRTVGSESLIPSSEQFQSARPDINLDLRDRRKGNSSKTD